MKCQYTLLKYNFIIYKHEIHSKLETAKYLQYYNDFLHKSSFIF